MFYFLKKVRLFSQNDVLFLFYFLINPTMTTVTVFQLVLLLIMKEMSKRMHSFMDALT